MKYYVKKEGIEEVPFTLSQLRKLDIEPETIVKKGKSSEWTPASEIPDLYDLFYTEQLNFRTEVEENNETTAVSSDNNITFKRVIINLIIMLCLAIIIEIFNVIIQGGLSGLDIIYTIGRILGGTLFFWFIAVIILLTSLIAYILKKPIKRWIINAAWVIWLLVTLFSVYGNYAMRRDGLVSQNSDVKLKAAGEDDDNETNTIEKQTVDFEFGSFKQFLSKQRIDPDLSNPNKYDSLKDDKLYVNKLYNIEIDFPNHFSFDRGLSEHTLIRGIEEDSALTLVLSVFEVDSINDTEDDFYKKFQEAPLESLNNTYYGDYGTYILKKIKASALDEISNFQISEGFSEKHGLNFIFYTYNERVKYQTYTYQLISNTASTIYKGNVFNISYSAPDFFYDINSFFNFFYSFELQDAIKDNERKSREKTGLIEEPITLPESI